MALYVGQCLPFRHYVVDDPYITFRYSLFLAEGHGPYFNPGEHVEGYTNFLLMLLMSAVARLAGAGAMPLAAKAIGLGCGVLAVAFTYRLAGRLAAAPDRRHEPLAGMLAAGFVAASPGFAVNSTSGLETTLYSLLITLGVLSGEAVGRRGAWLASALAFSAALLTRPEGSLIFGVYWIASALHSWRRPSDGRPLRELCLMAGIVCAVFLAQILFRIWVYNGEWLPNTFYAKQGGVSWPWPYIQAGAIAPFGGIAGAAFAAAAALGGVGRGRLMVVAAPALFGALTPFIVGTDWMLGERFVVPYLPLLAAVLAVGWWRAIGAVAMPQFMRATILAAVVAAVWFAQGAERAGMLRHIVPDAYGFQTGHMALAQWLDKQCSPGDTIALMDVGIVGYKLPQLRILDISGLTDRHIGKSPGGFLEKRYDSAYIFDQAPRFIVLTMGLPPGRLTRSPSNIDPRFGSGVENVLYHQAAFQQLYTQHAATGQPGTLGDWARALRAEQVFLHAYPDADYLLVVYRRQDGGASAEN